MYKLNRKDVPIITYGLLTIQIIVFILEILNGGSTNSLVLYKFGAKLNYSIIQGQWWRLITPMFIHIGFTHLLMNSLTLYYAGIQLENLFGHFKFFIIYMVSGIFGNIMSFAFSDPRTLSAGASTGLFGLFATYMALAFMNRDNPYLNTLGKQFMTLIVLNIVIDVFMSGIDIWGHIGGAIGGFLITIIIEKNMTQNKNTMLRIALSLLLLVLVVFLYSIGMRSMVV